MRFFLLQKNAKRGCVFLTTNQPINTCVLYSWTLQNQRPNFQFLFHSLNPGPNVSVRFWSLGQLLTDWGMVLYFYCFNSVIRFYILVPFSLRFPLLEKIKGKAKILYCSSCGVSCLCNFLQSKSTYILDIFSFLLNLRCWVCYKENIWQKQKKIGYLSLIFCDFCEVGKICIFVYDPFMKGTTLLASLIFVTSRYFGSFSSLVF